MSSLAKQAREAMKAKASRLTTADPHQKVDSSTWTPPEALNTEVKTGLRPVSRRAFKSGGAVGGKKAKVNLGKAPRTGNKAITADSLINRNVKNANEERPGGKAHVGGYKKGGRTKKASGGMPLPPKRPSNLSPIPPEKPVDRKKIEPGDAASRDLNRMMDIQRQEEAQERCWGGKTKKKADGGATDAAQRMMAKAQKTAGVPAGGIYGAGFSPTGAGSLSPAAMAGKRTMKKGGTAKHDDVKADMALIKKMVKPAAMRKGRQDGGETYKDEMGRRIGRREYEYVKNPTFPLKEGTYENGNYVPPSQLESTKNYFKTAGNLIARTPASIADDAERAGPLLSDAAKKAASYIGDKLTDFAQLKERGYKKGGKAKRTARKEGGGVFSGPGYPGKVPGVTGGRIAKQAGGTFYDPVETLGVYRPEDEINRQMASDRFVRRGGENMRDEDIFFQGPDKMVGMFSKYSPERAIDILAAQGRMRQMAADDKAALDAASRPYKKGGRVARATGGKTKGKGKTHINIMIASGKPAGMDMMPPGGPTLPPGMDGGPGGIAPVPMAPSPGGAPGAAPMPMPIPMPMPMAGGPAGGPPTPRKSGGRLTAKAKSYKDMTAGAGSGEGRLQKTDIAKARMGRKAGGKTYRSYKDMDAGAGSGLGRLEKTEIQAHKR